MEKQDMQQIIAMLAKLDAKLDAYQEKASADRKTAKEEILARMDAKMKSYQ